MSYLQDYDWRKQAAQTAQPDDAIEKAFFDQASTFVANKAAPLMRDPYRLGFEIVQKDDDNTKMVGIFAFRIAQDLYYAPAFFLNGEIKGTDLFYRHTTKSFVPLTEDWVKFLLEQEDQSPGAGIGRDERKKHPADMQLRRIAVPPSSSGTVGNTGGFKYASAEGNPNIVWEGETPNATGNQVIHKIARTHRAGDIQINWAEFFNDASKQASLGPIIRQYLVEDGGYEAFVKIATACKENHVFLKRLVESCNSVDDFLPAELPEEIIKVAAAKPEPKLVLFTGMADGIKQANNREDLFTRGYCWMDKRAEDEISVLHDAPKNVQTVSVPGYYKVLLRDGEQVEAFCARDNPEQICSGISYGTVPGSYPWSEDDYGAERMCFITKDGRYGQGRMILADPIMEENGTTRKTEGDILKKEMSSGEVYTIYDSKKGTFCPPFYVVRKHEKNGLTVYEIAPDTYSNPRELKVNPDYNGMDLHSGICGGPGYFIKLDKTHGDKVEGEAVPTGNTQYNFGWKRVEPADEDNLRDWIEESGTMKEATINLREDGYAFQCAGHGSSKRLDRVNMAAALAGSLHIKAASVDTLLDLVDKEGSHRFIVQPPATKRAGTIRLMNEANFQQLYDGDFGTPVETPQRFALDTHTEQDFAPPHHVGDAWDPGMGHGPVKDASDDDGLPMDTLLNSSPQQLQQLAQQDNVPHMFEHGVVGSLVNTFDSASQIDKYLPKIEEGLDCMGRILFLFYWKPGDFQSLYGVDDMTNLENELLSNFKSMGAITLNLMKKSRNKQRGTGQLTSKS